MWHIPAIWYTFSTVKDFDMYRVNIEGEIEQGVEIDLEWIWRVRV